MAHHRISIVTICLGLMLVACVPVVSTTAMPAAASERTPDESTTEHTPDVPHASIVGPWRAVLQSPGGDLPFTLEIRPREAAIPAVIVNGDEEAPTSALTIDGRRIRIEIKWYDARIEASLSDDGETLTGRWIRANPVGHSELPFTATRGRAARFPSAGPPAIDISGTWDVMFVDESGGSVAIGEFRCDGRQTIGTFLTPTGDYRFLEGSVTGRELRLSCFDGAHAFLFHARVGRDGRMIGNFWSRDSYHAAWTATRRTEDDHAFDAWSLTRIVSPDRRFRFDLPDQSGQRHADTDDRFGGKVVVVNIFGSWCPNCHDEAPMLADWQTRYADDVEFLGLAFEFTGDVDRDWRQVDRFRAKYGLTYPILLAGTSDKSKAAASLPDLSAVIAYPTTLFIGRDGRVRKIHTGFSGPGTGRHHEALITEMTQVVEALIAE